MKKVKLSFKFTTSTELIMNCFYEGEGETREWAIGEAWKAMAEDNFKRQIIDKTVKIELIQIEDIN